MTERCHSEEGCARRRNLGEAPIKFIYVIPDFNNPSGETMTLEERKEIVALARELDVVIV